MAVAAMSHLLYPTGQCLSQGVTIHTRIASKKIRQDCHQHDSLPDFYCAILSLPHRIVLTPEIPVSE